MNNLENDKNFEPNLNDPNLYRDLVVLYCPQKVGSTSLVSSIRISVSNKFNVFHTHEDIIYKSYSNMKDLTIGDILKNAGTINKFTGKPRKVYLIDIYRNPIERKISEYFENLGVLHFNNVGENLYNYPMDKITQRFNDLFPHISTVDYYQDIYPIPKPKNFDFDKKYLIHENENITYVKLRLSDSEYWGEILKKILGTEITIVKDYETEKKPIGYLYNNFKLEYKLPYNYYKMIESDKELNFYLTPKEKEEYLKTWSNKLGVEHKGFTLQEYDFYLKISNENQFYEITKSGHYLDDGCNCDECNGKRKKFLFNIKNNIENHDLKNIIHTNQFIDTNCRILLNCHYPNGDSIMTIYNVV